MRIDEFDLPKEIQNAQKKQQELKVLAGKVKQMYTKALKNYDEVEQELDTAFKVLTNWRSSHARNQDILYLLFIGEVIVKFHH